MEDKSNQTAQASSTKDGYRSIRLSEFYESQFAAKRRKPKHRADFSFIPFTAKQSQRPIKPENNHERGDRVL